MLLMAENLSKEFFKGRLNKSRIRAVDGVSFSINQGEIMGLVGESGSGKSTVGRLLLLLLEPTEGRIYFNGKELTRLRKKELQNLRKDMQIIFQHPQESLNPRMKIYESMAEPIRLYGLADGKSREKEEILKLLETVGLTEEHLERYPHELSGGQAQRVAIARVLALKPKFVVADEPTSMLDVSVQAQILKLIKKLQREYKISFLFISHDLEVVRAISDRIAIMQKGKIVELGEPEQIFSMPRHPYTKYLINSILNL
ncbi:MAG TPA: ABC transporter ATP-binding protein [Peptococcaceae bacterium]|nr:MAG: ABC transporter related [Clostridia bacterium 41_269]HBT20556.1 ABC transporter ATP-binding protein [Peptococcaceae bacterium]